MTAQERLAALRAQLRLRRGNEQTLLPEFTVLERALLDRRRGLQNHRDVLSSHPAKPFVRFEAAIEAGRLALARQRPLKAVQQFVAAMDALDIIESQVGLRAELTVLQRSFHQILALTGDAAPSLSALPAFAAMKTLLDDAGEAIRQGKDCQARSLLSMHRLGLEGWRNAPNQSVRKSLTTLRRLLAAPPAYRPLPYWLGPALDAIEGADWPGLAGIAALDSLARLDHWRQEGSDLLAHATASLENTVERLRDHLHPIAPEKRRPS